jgi:hypothetical protein
MIELLGTETTRNGQKVEIKFVKFQDLTDVKVTSFFLRQWAELIESGHANASYFPNLTHTRILFTTIDDQITAHLVWSWINKTSFIDFTAVDKNYRRQGLYEILHTYYDQIMIRENATLSRSQLHINNEAIINGAKKAGYEVEYVRMVKHYK